MSQDPAQSTPRVSSTELAAMDRALAIALNGPRGLNPQVGAVILSPSGEILAEGWHRGAGTPHAEVDALSQLAPGQARGATAVVTLEPCNHHGRTGPCAVALLDAGITRVVFSVNDPAGISSGGAERLATHGVEVIGGVRSDDGHALLESWLTVIRLGRPHVTVKWAQSLDGRAAAADGTSQWITGPAARADVHRRRSASDAIVAGIGTVLADDPALTARDADGSLLPNQPVPVVLGRRGIPTNAAVLRHPHPLVHHDGLDLSSLLDELRESGIQRVFVEGGPTVASAFLRAGLADEVLTYIAPTLLGAGSDGTDRPAVGSLGVDTISDQRRLTIAAVHTLGDDLLIVAHPVPPQSAEEGDA